MTISSHRKIELCRAVLDRDPDRVRVMSGCVLLLYGELLINVRRRDWTVTIPGKPDEAEFLMELGVCERAKMAVEIGEGYRRQILSDECLAQRERLVEAQEAMRRALGL
jgi:hypothetical protein